VILSVWDSVILIASKDPEHSRNFGTGFIIYQDKLTTYLLTCAHVVRDVGGSGKVMADGFPASVVVSGEKSGFDLAVLKVEGFLEKTQLSLCASADQEKAFIIIGYYEYTSKSPPALRKIRGTMGKQIRLASRDGGERINAWDLKIDGEDKLVSGYSGSPVIDEISGHVMGVVSHQMDTIGKMGLAISIDALKKIWCEMPNGLITTPTAKNYVLEAKSKPLPQDKPKERLPISASKIQKRYQEKVLIQQAIRLIPKENFRADGLLGKDERKYVFIGDYAEQRHRSLRQILANLWMGDAFDEVSKADIEWIAIIFEIGEINYHKLDLMPATWKAMFRIISDPNRLGYIEPSDEEKLKMGLAPRNYYSENQEYWYSSLRERIYNGMDFHLFLKSCFGVYNFCFNGKGITTEKKESGKSSTIASRVFLVKNVPLTSISYKVQELGATSDQIILE
jgi:hypothetical protein